MSPIALTDAQMREVKAAAQMVPWDLRPAFLERLASALRDRDLGDGFVHRTAYEIARSIIWETEQTAFG